MNRAEEVLFTFDGIDSPQEALRRIADADREIRSVNIEIELVGTKEEKTTAEALRSSAWELASHYASYTKASAETRLDAQAQFEATHRKYDSARSAFLQATRKSLLAK